jgi:hypothetical protein
MRDTVQVRVQDIRISEAGALIDYQLDNAPECLDKWSLQFSIDQDQSRSLLSRPVAGPVLWAQSEPSGHVRLLGEPAVIAGLDRMWRQSGRLEPVIGSEVTLEFFSSYATEIELKYLDFRESFGAYCQPVFQSRWHCSQTPEMTYTQVPACIASPATADQMYGTLDIQDPFVKNTDPNISLSAVTRDLCSTPAHRQPFWLGLANDVLFSNQRRFQVTRPAVVRMKVKLSWPR